jgi:hypothetical protein
MKDVLRFLTKQGEEKREEVFQQSLLDLKKSIELTAEGGFRRYYHIRLNERDYTKQWFKQPVLIGDTKRKFEYLKSIGLTPELIRVKGYEDYSKQYYIYISW